MVIFFFYGNEIEFLSNHITKKISHLKNINKDKDIGCKKYYYCFLASVYCNLFFVVAFSVKWKKNCAIFFIFSFSFFDGHKEEIMWWILDFILVISPHIKKKPKFKFAKDLENYLRKQGGIVQSDLKIQGDFRLFINFDFYLLKRSLNPILLSLE